MKQRVLFAIYEMSGGGSQRQILGILKHLDHQRFEPELYVVFDNGELLSEVPDDVPVHIFERRNTATIGRLPGAGFRLRARDLAEVLDERQIHVLYDRTYHMTMLTAAATRLRPTPRISVIVTDPKLDFETNPEKFRFIKRRLVRNAYRDADVVAAVSEGVRIAAADYHGIPLNRIETVYNFFDVDQIDRMSHEKLPGKGERSKDHFCIAAAGRLHRQKGFDVLIEAARKAVHEYGHQQLSLVILGTGESRSQLERQIREARLQDHVRLAGFHINPLPIYRDSDLFVLSSRYEGMPNALVEAMLCGVPVLSTDCPSGPSEILQGGQLGGLVPVEDASALAAAIDDAITNHPQWQQRSAEAHAQIVERFSAESGIERVTALFGRAIARFQEEGR